MLLIIRIYIYIYTSFLRSPSLSIYRGGITYTITGINLDSVQEPHLLIYYDEGSADSGGRNRRQITTQDVNFLISEVYIIVLYVFMYAADIIPPIYII